MKIGSPIIMGHTIPPMPTKLKAYWPGETMSDFYKKMYRHDRVSYIILLSGLCLNICLITYNVLTSQHVTISSAICRYIALCIICIMTGVSAIKFLRLKEKYFLKILEEENK